MIDPVDRTLITPTAILPGQISGGQRVDGDTSGPRALLLAILEDAARCIAKGRQRGQGRTRSLAEEAERWVRSGDRTWPFSFANISDLLGIDPDALRRHLLRSGENDAPERHRNDERDPVLAVAMQRRARRSRNHCVVSKRRIG